MYLDIDKKDAERTALLDSGGERMTYGELVRMASSLKLEDSLRPVVFALAESTTGFASWLITLLEQGAIPLLLPADLPEEFLMKLDEMYQPAYYLLADSRLSPAGQKVAHHAGSYSLVRTGHAPFETSPELELLLSTSGSTGSPKLVRFRRGNMENNAKNVQEAFGWNEKERGLCSLPLNYVMGLNVFFTHLYSGATALLTNLNLMEQGYWDFVREERATNFTGVPFSYEVLRRLRLERMNLPHLTTFAQGGGKLSEKTFRMMAELAHKQGWEFVATYGTTETSARCSLLRPELALSRILSIGKAIPGVEMLLMDDLGKPVTEPRFSGTLIIRGDHVAMGYALNREDLLKGDEWQGTYDTGDLAWFDEEGFFYISGRKKRFTKLLGNRIGLDECEAILSNEFGRPAACIGQEDSLHIITEDAEEGEAMRQFLAARLKLKASLFTAHVVEKIPRNDSGKVQYRKLEEEFFK